MRRLGYTPPLPLPLQPPLPRLHGLFMSQANRQNRQIQVTTLARIFVGVRLHPYQKGRDNAIADFLSRLPLRPLEDELSGCYKLNDPDDLGVYLRACGRTSPTSPSPGVGLGGLTPPATSISG